MKESVIRTIVPVLVALLVREGVDQWLAVTQEWLTIVLTAVVTGLYYVGARVLERFKSSKWGWLLGYPSAPLYPPTPPVDQ